MALFWVILKATILEILGAVVSGVGVGVGVEVGLGTGVGDETILLIPVSAMPT